MRPKKKRTKQKYTCYLDSCRKRIFDPKRHMMVFHKLTPADADNRMSTHKQWVGSRNLEADPTRYQQCSFGDCSAVVQRLDHHLRQVHRLSKCNSKPYMKADWERRRQVELRIRNVGIEVAGPCSSSNAGHVGEVTRPSHPGSESDMEEESEGSEDGEGGEFSDDEEEFPEPCCLQDDSSDGEMQEEDEAEWRPDNKSSVGSDREIKEDFLGWLKSISGGMKSEAAAAASLSQVEAFLAELGGVKGLKHYQRLAEKEGIIDRGLKSRAPSTVKCYLLSFNTFVTFMDSRGQMDPTLVARMKADLVLWRKALRLPIRRRRAAMRIAENEIVRDIMENSKPPRHSSFYEEKMTTLRTYHRIQNFTKSNLRGLYRDAGNALAIVLGDDNMQRFGAVAGMTRDEFDAARGVLDKSHYLINVSISQVH